MSTSSVPIPPNTVLVQKVKNGFFVTINDRGRQEWYIAKDYDEVDEHLREYFGEKSS